MLYQMLLDKLLAVSVQGGVKLGLANMRTLDAALGSPSSAFRAVHVAGTNGKGSVSLKIAKGLELSGQRVGLFTSPHISCFRERIQINGKKIPKAVVLELLPKLFELAEEEKCHPTFFELTTLLAFLYFAREKVDVAVLEVGLGGRLDATNIVMPTLSIITSISLDHMELLGSTVEQITWEKGGIIKPFVPLVLGPRVPRILSAHRVIEVEGEFSSFDEENSAIASASMQELGIAPEVIRKAICLRPACRLERFWREGVEIIFDVAHNPDGLQALFRALSTEKRAEIVLGLSATKDLRSCIKMIAPHGAHFHLVQASNGRGASVEELKRLLVEQGIAAECIFALSTLAAAIEYAKESSKLVVVCGSFFIMSEMRSALGLEEERDEIDMNERGLR